MRVNLLFMCGVNHCCTLAVEIEVFFVSYNLLAGCFAGAFGFSTLKLSALVVLVFLHL